MKHVAVLLTLLILIAGCSSSPAVPVGENPSESPVTTPPEAPESLVQKVEQKGYEFQFERALKDRDLDSVRVLVDDLASDGGKAAVLSYQDPGVTEESVGGDVGFTVAAFLGMLDEGWDAEELASWYLTQEWIEGYQAGTLLYEAVAYNALLTFEASGTASS